jgi:mRNA interferase HigB
MEHGRKHPETLPILARFYHVARKANWRSFIEVRDHFPSADQVRSVLIFNILGGNYRLITRVDYQSQRLFVKALLTHREYDRKEWLKWA